MKRGSDFGLGDPTPSPYFSLTLHSFLGNYEREI